MTAEQLKNRGRFIFDSASGYRSTAQQRPNDQNPISPACRMHLRRICGVCQSFGGASMLSQGPCAKLGGEVRGGSSAADCSFWCRRSAPQAVTS